MSGVVPTHKETKPSGSAARGGDVPRELMGDSGGSAFNGGEPGGTTLSLRFFLGVYFPRNTAVSDTRV